MSIRRVLLLLFLLGSTGSVAAGYGMAGHWREAGLAVLPGFSLAFRRRFPVPWLPAAFLSGMVCLSAAGMLLGAPSFLMVCGASMALAVWDLVNLDRSMEGSGSSPAAGRFEKKHARVLALALGLGLLSAAVGIALSLHVPFIIMLLLVLLDLFSLDRVFRYLNGWTRRVSGPRL